MKTPVDYTGFRPDVPGSLLVGVRLVGRKFCRGSWNNTWLWRCDCGNEVEEVPAHVRSGNRKSCGCLRQKTRMNIVPAKPGERRKPITDITGQRFGRLLALHALDERIKGRVYWVCQCDCGATKSVEGRQLRSGKTQSCGCRLADAARRNVAAGRLVQQAKAAAKRNPLAAGLLPHLMPKINHQQAQRVNLLGDE